MKSGTKSFAGTYVYRQRPSRIAACPSVRRPCVQRTRQVRAQVKKSGIAISSKPMRLKCRCHGQTASSRAAARPTSGPISARPRKNIASTVAKPHSAAVSRTAISVGPSTAIGSMAE